MTRLKGVKTLKHIAIQFLARLFHSRFKECALCMRKHDAQDEFHELREWAQDVIVCQLPVAIQVDIFREIQCIITTREKGYLDEAYYSLLNAFLNRSTRVLHLDQPKLFQDSSLAMEAFLASLSTCEKLRELSIPFRVMELVDFDFIPILNVIGDFADLNTLSLQGLSQLEDVNSDAMLEFLIQMSINSPTLRSLDLCGVPLGEEACSMISQMTELQSLRLNRCSIQPKSIIILLTSLRELTHFDCDYKIQNLLLSSDNDIHHQGGSKLENLAFRGVSGLSEILGEYPMLTNIDIDYAEFGNQSEELDEALQELAMNVLRPSSVNVKLALEGFNMLYFVQMERWADYGPMIQKVVLTQCQFLHPQSLNPLAMHCPNLEHLALLGCAPISNDMFEGELPDLEREPFTRLRELAYDGQLPPHLAHFLLKASGSLEIIRLHTRNGPLSSSMLELLADIPRTSLKECYISFDRCQVDFLSALKRFIASCPTLERLEILSCDPTKKSTLQRLAQELSTNNVDLQFLFHAKPKPRVA